MTYSIDLQPQSGPAASALTTETHGERFWPRSDVSNFSDIAFNLTTLFAPLTRIPSPMRPLPEKEKKTVSTEGGAG